MHALITPDLPHFLHAFVRSQSTGSLPNSAVVQVTQYQALGSQRISLVLLLAEHLQHLSLSLMSNLIVIAMHDLVMLLCRPPGVRVCEAASAHHAGQPLEHGE